MTEPSSVSPGRTLILLRHAKAEREAGVADIDRPLTARGRADAAAAGAWLARYGTLPDQVLCSPSRRTRQTWAEVRLGIAEAAGGAAEAAPDYKPAIWYETGLYHGTAGDLLSLLRRVTPQTSTLLVIGHNPTVSEVSELLDPAHAERDGMRTSGVAVHQVPGTWANLRPGSAPVADRYTARAG